MAETNLIHFGSHQASFDPPDVAILRWNGDVSPGDMREYLNALERFSASCPNLFVLHDMRNSGIPGQDARKAVAHDPRMKLIRATAIVGASFQVRVVATMLAKAAQLVSKSLMKAEFFDTEQAARKWFDQEREKSVV